MCHKTIYTHTCSVVPNITQEQRGKINFRFVASSTNHQHIVSHVCVLRIQNCFKLRSFGNKTQQLFFFHPTPQKENSSLMAPSFFIYFFIRQTFHVLLEAQFSMIFRGKANNTLSDTAERKPLSPVGVFGFSTPWECERASENPSNCREILEVGQRAASSKDSRSLARLLAPKSNIILAFCTRHASFCWLRGGKNINNSNEKWRCWQHCHWLSSSKGEFWRDRKNGKNVSFLKDTACVTYQIPPEVGGKLPTFWV